MSSLHETLRKCSKLGYFHFRRDQCFFIHFDSQRQQSQLSQMGTSTEAPRIYIISPITWWWHKRSQSSQGVLSDFGQSEVFSDCQLEYVRQMRGRKFRHGRLDHLVGLVDGSRIFLRTSRQLELNSYSQEQAEGSRAIIHYYCRQKMKIKTKLNLQTIQFGFSEILLDIVEPKTEGWIIFATMQKRYRECETRRVEYWHSRRIVKAINVAPLSICLLAGGKKTRIDRQIDDASLQLRGQRQEFW